MVDISAQMSGILACSLIIAVFGLRLAGRVRVAVCLSVIAVSVALRVWGLKVPISETAADWLGWLNLAMLLPMIYFGASYAFDRKWTVPDLEPESD